MKHLSLIILLFFSLKLFGFSKPNNEEWHDEVKKFYFDYKVALNEYKNKNYDKAFQILHVPGHTLAHIAFYSSNAGVIFTGDTLFSFL